MNKIIRAVFACLIVAVAKNTIVSPFLISRTTDEDEKWINADHSLDRFIFTTEQLPDDPEWLPTLGNGHIGFTVFSDEILMNGLYNGKKGLSHRARIPNFGQFFMTDCNTKTCKYTLDVRRGIFVVELKFNNEYIATHFIYAHRFHTRAVINQVHIQRLGSQDEIKIRLNSRCAKEIFGNISSTKRRTSNAFYNHENIEQSSGFQASDDLDFIRNETIQIDGRSYNLLCGHTKELENVKEYKRFENPGVPNKNQQEEVFVLWNHVPDEIALEKDSDSKMFTFAMTIDGDESFVVMEMVDIFRTPGEELLKRHTDQWELFWRIFEIDGNQENGDDDLVRAILSSVFYISSSLPSTNTNLKPHLFYGLSPTGLGRGSSLTDYEGHSMWDSEMWMLPPVALINPDWAKQLLHYRYIMITAAEKYANETGYRGVRFPWESAATGIEVVQPGYEYIAKYQVHISADISFALKYYSSQTHDKKFLQSEGCKLATSIAEFWASRVQYNATTDHYDIRHVMGPDEDHSNVSNNLYTNIIAINALKFGWFAKCVCDRSELDDAWLKIAEKITVLYDPQLDYHPQFAGYKVGTEIKQADVILTTFPLMYPFNRSSVLNDLKFYSNVTREDGPAMSFSMYAISYLDANDERSANKMLKKSFEPYIRQPFNVWSELGDTATEAIGAANFVTGAGGFLQLIFNGFFGIRVHPKHIEIKNPRLPENYTFFRAKGLCYLNSKFQLEIFADKTLVTFHQLADKLKIQLEGKQPIFIEENTPYHLDAETSCNISSPIDVFEGCDLNDL